MESSIRPSVADTWVADATRAFAELALITVDLDPPERTLRRVAELAKHSWDGVEDVSLTVIARGQPQSVVFTGPLAVELDERQYKLGFGPCLDAAKTGQTLQLDTTAADSPYSEFGRIAARAGVRHVLSLGMPIAQRSIGGMNIYCTTDTISPEFVDQAQILTKYATVTVNNITAFADAVTDAENLRAAMQSRAVIEQAKGMIMIRDRCTADEAFAILTRISQQKNIKIRDIAQTLVDSLTH
jgi:GAF domain-containing protein